MPHSVGFQIVKELLPDVFSRVFRWHVPGIIRPVELLSTAKVVNRNHSPCDLCHCDGTLAAIASDFQNRFPSGQPSEFFLLTCE
jgi:hypothetical protein